MAISQLEYEDDSDVALVRRARAGDTDAYAVLHERHVRAAQRLAWRLSRSPIDADDLVNEAFARVLSIILRGGGPEISFRSYLLRTVRRLAYDRSHREVREWPSGSGDPEVADANSSDYLISGYESDLAAEAFASLPERWRTVLWHTEVEGERPADVARRLGISPNAVAALAYRAREGLRRAYLGLHAGDRAPATDECALVSPRLAGFVRRSFSDQADERIAAHLEECDRCRAAWLALLEEAPSLRSLVAIAVLGSAGPLYLEATGAPSPGPASKQRRRLDHALRGSGRLVRSIAGMGWWAAAAVLLVAGGATGLWRAASSGRDTAGRVALAERPDPTEPRHASHTVVRTPGRSTPAATSRARPPFRSDRTQPASAAPTAVAPSRADHDRTPTVPPPPPARARPLDVVLPPGAQAVLPPPSTSVPGSTSTTMVTPPTAVPITPSSTTSIPPPPTTTSVPTTSTTTTTAVPTTTSTSTTTTTVPVEPTEPGLPVEVTTVGALQAGRSGHIIVELRNPGRGERDLVVAVDLTGAGIRSNADQFGSCVLESAARTRCQVVLRAGRRWRLHLFVDVADASEVLVRVAPADARLDGTLDPSTPTVVSLPVAVTA